MLVGARTRRGKLALLFGAALTALTGIGALGCDAGGLLVVEGKNNEEPPAKARSATEVVSGGTLAQNAKYKIFYVLGQPTPMQDVATSPDHRVNGGLAGAVGGK